MLAHLLAHGHFARDSMDRTHRSFRSGISCYRKYRSVAGHRLHNLRHRGGQEEMLVQILINK